MIRDPGVRTGARRLRLECAILTWYPGCLVWIIPRQQRDISMGYGLGFHVVVGGREGVNHRASVHWEAGAIEDV